MTSESRHDAVPLPLQDERKIDSICDAFETEWIAGRQPVVESYLGDLSGPARTALICELVLLDIGYRCGIGEHPSTEFYATRFPEMEVAWLQAMIAVERQSRASIDLPSESQTNFGDYELMNEVARGGMGVVYKARQVSLNRIVALKMILSGLQASPADVERFHAEAAAAANLDHPGIVPIFEVGAFQGQHYFSMGFIEGRSLAELLAQGPIAAREAARLTQSICEAVQYAHDHQVIHRDLKPANILLDRDGRPRVTDFGLAKCLTDDSGRTRSGQAFGTPSYIPPEQAAGKLEAIGPAADIYALGAILYAMLTGRPPFQAASSVDTLRQVIDNEPLRPSDLAPGTPRDLETIALKCLQKRIADRYGSARELGEDLGRYLDGRTITARPISRWERGWRWCRRNPYLALLGGAVAILVSMIAVVSTVSAIKYREQLTRAETAVLSENLAKQDALSKLWDSYLVSARAGRMSKQPGQRFASLRAIASALALATPKDRSIDELRTEAIAAMMLPDFEEAKRCPGYPRGTLSVTIDPTFQRYASGGADGNVSLRKVADDREIARIPGIGPLEAYDGLVFSSGGQYLMQCCNTAQGHVRRIWALGEPPKLVLNCGDTYDFSPDGRRLATIAMDASIRLYDLNSGKEACRYQLPGFVPDWLLWNPRRPILFARTNDRRSYRLLDLSTGKFGTTLSAPYGITWLRWHPEGRLLAIADTSMPHPKIHLVRADTGEPAMPPLESHRTGGLLVRFNHYGDRLLSTDWSGLWRLWDVRTGQLLLTQPAIGNELRFSDDDRLAGLDLSPHAIKLFRVESGREFYKIVRRVNSGPGAFSNFEHGSCQLDREGRLLAYSVPEGISIVDVVRGEEVTLLPKSGNFPIRADNSGKLYTHGSAGLLEWPMKRDPSGGRVYGPPRKCALPLGKVLDGGACDKDCKVFVVGDFNEGAIEYLLTEGRQIRLGPQEDVRHCTVSPDGQWTVTGSHGNSKGIAAEIWSAKTGKHERDLPVAALCDVAFSPDGRWLLTTGGGARLWSVGDWKEGARLGSSAKPGAFSAAGDILALQDVPGVVRLVLSASGKEVAKLTAPEAMRITPLCFTRDGNRLVCWIADEETLCVFNLGLIRSKLAEMGLDWEGSPCPVESDHMAEPIAVQFVGAR